MFTASVSLSLDKDVCQPIVEKLSETFLCVSQCQEHLQHLFRKSSVFLRNIVSQNTNERRQKQLLSAGNNHNILSANMLSLPLRNTVVCLHAMSDTSINGRLPVSYTRQPLPTNSEV